MGAPASPVRSRRVRLAAMARSARASSDATAAEQRGDTLARRTAQAAASVAALLALAAVAAWALGSEPVKTVLRGHAGMNVNTAVACLLLAAALWLSAWAASHPRAGRLATLAAASGSLIGLLTLAEDASGISLGIDQILRKEVGGSGMGAPAGRLAPATALALTLLGAALIVKRRPGVGRARSSAAEAVALSSASIAALPLVGHLYGVLSLTGAATPTRMALQTATVIIVLSAGVIALPPFGALMARVADRGPGGTLIRRTLPPLIAALVALGWLRLAGERAGFYETEFGLAVMVVAAVTLIAATLFATAQRLDRMTAQQRAAAEHAAAVFAASPAVLYTLELTAGGLRLSWVSENLPAVFGHEIEEALRPGWWDAHARDEGRNLVATRLAAVEEKDRWEEEYRFEHKDGTELWVRDELRVERDASRAIRRIVGAWTDVTEARRLREQVLQAQRLESLGRLAGGVAHDFNNLLAVILATAEANLGEVRGDDPVRDDLVVIRDTAKRAAALTRQLLAFGRRQAFEPRVVNLNELVTQARSLLRHVVGEHVELVVVTDPHLGNAWVDPAQLERVIVNLALNARDAMPSGGSLTIETSNVEIDARTAREAVGLTPGPYVALTVTDTGTGMDALTVQRMFEPFYTTKPSGRGTGLGLASSYGFVRQSGGAVLATSVPGSGTTVRVLLPRVTAPAATPPPATAGEPSGGPETILLVDDDADVLAVTKRVLEAAGYRVLAASGAKDATRAAALYDGTIHLLLSDVVMPETSGPELAARLSAARPGLAVLFMSGHADAEITQQGVFDPAASCIDKPFDVATLTSRVREALDAAARSRAKAPA